jgi:hypothetical protein
MKNAIIFIVSLYSFVANGQDIYNFKSFNSLLENPIDVRENELKRSGYTYNVQNENWISVYSNKDTTTNLGFQIYPKLGFFTTQDRTLYLKMVESILENKLVQVPKNMEIKSTFLGELDGRICYKGLGYYYVSQEVRYDKTSVYVIYFGKIENWMKLVAYEKLPVKGESIATTKEDDSSLDYDLYDYESKLKKELEKKERRENKLPFDYWAMHIGLLMPIGTLNEITPQSKGNYEPYKNGKTFGAKYGIQIGYSGLISPKAFNATFSDFFNLSLAWKVDYSGMPIDQSKRDTSNISFNYTGLSRASGGIGPAITFCDPTINWGISFYYIPQMSLAFGGGFHSDDYKIELERDKIVDFSYLGSIGFTAVFNEFQFGIEYAKYLENSLFTYDDTTMPNFKPVNFNSNILVKQVIFRIGYTFSTW